MAQISTVGIALDGLLGEADYAFVEMNSNVVIRRSWTEIKVWRRKDVEKPCTRMDIWETGKELGT